MNFYNFHTSVTLLLKTLKYKKHSAGKNYKSTDVCEFFLGGTDELALRSDILCAFLLFVLVSGFLNLLWIRYSDPSTESLNEIFS